MANQVMMLSQYGCDEVTRPELSMVATPEPTNRVLQGKRTKGTEVVSHQPIPHDYLLDMTEDCLADIGFRFGEQHHGLSHDGNRYFGVIELLSGENYDEFSMVVGLRNSHDKRFPAGVAFGMRVMVCANLCFGGEVTIARRHTRKIMRDLPNLVAAAVSSTKYMEHVQVERFEAYQNAAINDRDADHIIMNLLRNGTINATRVPKVVQEWDEPSHDFGGRTVWRLHNAVTETLKGTQIQLLPQRTIGLNALCDEYTGFIPRAA